MNWRTRFMPYDLYERHAAVSRLLRQSLGAESAMRVLDVGGRVDLLAQFTPHHITTLNVDGTADVLYDGGTMPFASRSFDAVINIDTLEHLPQPQRRPFLQECVRVSRQGVIVAAPFGSEAHRARERELDALYRQVNGRAHIYLSEHVQYGLPTAQELDEMVQQLPLRSAVRYLAGDFTWQARQFEHVLRAQAAQGWRARAWALWHHVQGLALFHPVRLRTDTYATANRFYLVMHL